MSDSPVSVEITSTNKASEPILDLMLELIRTEYMRGLPDAYAGGPTGRRLSWDRLRELIDKYADAKVSANRSPTLALLDEARERHAASEPAPTMSPAVDPPADTGPVDDGAATAEQAEAAAPPARRTPPRAKRATRTTDQAEPAETREEES